MDKQSSARQQLLPPFIWPAFDQHLWLEERFHRLRFHPNLDTACSQHATTFMEAFTLPYLTKIVSTEPRHVPCDAVIGSYIQKQLDTGREGMSLTEVLDSALGKTGMASRNRINGLIGLMQLAKLVDVSPCQVDGRQRIVRCTSLGWETIAKFRQASLLPLDLLNNTRWAETPHDDHRFMAKFHDMLVAVFVEIQGISARFPQLKHILARTAGVEVMHTLWMASLQDGKPQPRVIAYPYQPQGRKLGVSRVHVFRLISDLADQGLLELTGEGGKGIVIRPAFLEFYRSYAATRFAMTEMSYVRARTAVSAARD